MMQDTGDKRRSTMHRVLSGTLIALSIAGLAWFVADRVDDEGSGATEVRSAERGSVDPSESQQYAAASENSDTDIGSEWDFAEASTQTELGLEVIVREFILTLYGGETGRPDGSYEPSIYAKLESTDPTILRRGQFELEVHVHLGVKFADDPYYQLLKKSIFANWDLCLKEYGLPSLEGFLKLTEEQQEALTKELGLVGERMRELERKCWTQSRIIAGKDDETDRLLGLQHQYYLSAAQAWVRANPDKVVPLPGSSAK